MAALAAGSATFAGKTEFSQEKYRKRKAKKYLTFASLQRPTARAICEVSLSTFSASVKWRIVENNAACSVRLARRCVSSVSRGARCLEWLHGCCGCCKPA